MMRKEFTEFQLNWQSEGVSLAEVLEKFNVALVKLNLLGQNLGFDVNIIGCEIPSFGC
jgi:DNA polymerase-3 subunit alpha